MDGMGKILDQEPLASLPSYMLTSADPDQATLRTAIDCCGTGVHSGRRVTMTLRPAEANRGIIFRRVDRPAGSPTDLAALHDRVVDTRLCTMLGDRADPALRVGTVEHLMAALAGFGIDNAVIEIDGPEVPILDGSSEPFLFLLECAGREPQAVARRRIEVLETVRVTDGEAFAELRPARGHDGLDMTLSIDFAAPAIGRQARSIRLTADSFRRELANARTFALAEEVAQLRAAGLALGGSMENAIVVDHARVLNPEGLRMPDEFVRHKLLDAVGDLALAGGNLCGRFVAHRTGHRLNNKLLTALFARESAWRWTPTFARAA